MGLSVHAYVLFELYSSILGYIYMSKVTLSKTDSFFTSTFHLHKSPPGHSNELTMKKHYIICDILYHQSDIITSTVLKFMNRVHF